MQFNDEKAQISEEDLQEAGETLAPYIAHVNEVSQNSYDHDEASINLPVDKDIMNAIGEAVRDKKTPDLKYVIVVGIGGSNLGTKAIYDALYGYTDQFTPERFPKCLFLDTINPALLSALETFLTEHVTHPEEVVVNIVSKSGKTTETLANADMLISALQEKWGTIIDRVVITTDFGSALWKKAETEEITRLPIQEKVGGRYSVLSAVGLFPLAMCDINVNALLEGARKKRQECLQENISQNPAARGAIALYLHNKRGKTIHDTFVFAPELESLGKWYRQLLGESVGKEKDKDGNIVHAGLTPSVSVGSTDLHSVGQLYLGGPKDKVTTFVWAKNPPAYERAVSGAWTDGIVSDVSGKGAVDIMTAIREGVQIAYEKHELPFMDATLNEISPEEIGAFLQFKMCEVMYLGYLLNVHTFNQPNVESYKEETRTILRK